MRIAAAQGKQKERDAESTALPYAKHEDYELERGDRRIDEADQPERRQHHHGGDDQPLIAPSAGDDRRQEAGESLADVAHRKDQSAFRDVEPARLLYARGPVEHG